MLRTSILKKLIKRHGVSPPRACKGEGRLIVGPVAQKVFPYSGRCPKHGVWKADFQYCGLCASVLNGILPAQRFQRSRKRGWRMPAGAVYVGRPTKWGNPHPIEGWKIESLNGQPVTNQFISEDYRRVLSVSAYRTDLEAGKLRFTVEDARRELRGKSLLCWCPLDQRCHADVLLEVANG